MAIRKARWPGGSEVVWRTLTWSEFNKISSLQDPPAVKALEVYKLCRIEGPSIETLPAGILVWIGDLELERSIFTGKFEYLSGPLQAARTLIPNNYLMAAQALVATVFKVSFDEIKNWDGETFLARVAQAEFMSGRTLDPVNPNDKQSNASNKKPKKPLTPAQQIAVDRKIETYKSSH